MTDVNQQIANASLDLKTIEDFVNLPEGSEVYPRLLTTFDVGTLSGVRREIFERGGLPATPFASKALLDADATLLNSAYAVVTDDADDTKNGLYQKTLSGWVKSDYDPLNQSKNYVDTNPLFAPAILKATDNLDNLETGIYYSTTGSYHDQIANMPPLTATYKLGVVICYRNGAVAYQKFLHYNTLEQWERVGNGGTSSFEWGAWQKIVGRSEFDSSQNNLLSKLAEKPSVNLFQHSDLSAATAETYQATLINEGGYPTLNMQPDIVSAVFYQQKLDGKYLRVGDTVTFKADVFTDVVGKNGAEIQIQALNDAGAALESSTVSNSLKANEWYGLSTSLLLPAGATKVRFRFVRRLGNTVAKFRKPLLISSSPFSKEISLAGSASVAALSANTVYVSKNGSNSNNGKLPTPYLTIQKAIDALPDGGNVVVLDSAEYRESVTINTNAHIKISATTGNRVNLFGSDKLIVTKTAGMTKVYQAPLAAKPVGMGGNRGKPAIFEWGTPSKPIPDDERHALQRGLTHRLPFTEMNEVATKAELDSVNGKWFWESGVIYFTATDGSDARLKRYEARARPVLTHSNGTIELVRVSSWFSNSYAMEFNSLAVKRTSCMAYGAYHNGFADNANYTESYKDIAGGNGNDGFNLTVSPSTLGRDESVNRIEGVYFDPYGHDNGDDGISCHYRSDCTIYGGLFEHNTKGDVIHVTGSNSTCYGTESRGTTNGFYTATNPDLDTVRVKTVMRCVGTKSTNNGYSYRAADNAELHLDDCVAITPSIMGYHQLGDGGVIRANNCKFDGDALKAKTGNIVVKNTNLLTP